MIKIGITGGIGSGKSVVAALLELSGIPVYIGLPLIFSEIRNDLNK